MDTQIEVAADPLAKLLDEAVRLCPLRTTTEHVVRLVNSDRASIAAIVQALSNDPALAASVLRVANSAMYPGTKLAQLDAAVMRIGLLELKELASAMTLLARFQSRDGVQVILHDRSVLAGGIARLLANATELALPSTAATCGLLSEIGAMVCLAVDGKQYAGLWKATTSALEDRVAGEIARYGVSSFEVGKRFLTRSLVPEEVCTAVGTESDAKAEELKPLQQLCLFARTAARLLLGGSKSGGYTKLVDQIDVLAGRVGLRRVDGRDFVESLKTSGLLRNQSHA